MYICIFLQGPQHPVSLLCPIASHSFGEPPLMIEALATRTVQCTPHKLRPL